MPEQNTRRDLYGFVLYNPNEPSHVEVASQMKNNNVDGLHITTISNFANSIEMAHQMNYSEEHFPLVVFSRFNNAFRYSEAYLLKNNPGLFGAIFNLAKSVVDAGDKICTMKAAYENKRLDDNTRNKVYSQNIQELSQDALEIVSGIIKLAKKK